MATFIFLAKWGGIVCLASLLVLLHFHVRRAPRMVDRKIIDR